MCRRNVAHRRMTSEYKNPRLLLLGGSLEYQRVPNQLSSLDTLLQQVGYSFILLMACYFVSSIILLCCKLHCKVVCCLLLYCNLRFRFGCVGLYLVWMCEKEQSFCLVSHQVILPRVQWEDSLYVLQWFN